MNPKFEEFKIDPVIDIKSILIFRMDYWAEREQVFDWIAHWDNMYLIAQDKGQIVLGLKTDGTKFGIYKDAIKDYLHETIQKKSSQQPFGCYLKMFDVSNQQILDITVE